MTWQTAGWATVMLLVGVAILFLASLIDDHSAFHAVLNDLGSVMIASVALAVFWELFGRRAFAREIFEVARTGADIRIAGLKRIGTSYLDDPDWDSLLADVTKLDIFFAYGRTWRNSHHGRLTELARKEGARLRVYLPDPDDSEDLKVLAGRFSMTAAQLAAAVEEAKEFFLDLRVSGGASIDVYYRSGAASFSCYRLDNTAVLTLYSHQRERTGVPTLICRSGGSLYEFMRKEFDAIHQQSHPAGTTSS